MGNTETCFLVHKQIQVVGRHHHDHHHHVHHITWHSYSPASASCGRWIFNVHVSGLASALCKGTNLIFLDHDAVDDYDHDHYHGDDDVDDEMKMMISKRHLR